MLDGIASAAWRRPWAFLGAAAALLAALVALAAGVLGGLGHGAPSAGEAQRSELILATSPETHVSPQAYDVALDAIAANLEADPAVAVARVGREGAKQGQAVIDVEFATTDGGERRRLAEEIESSIDPGPLQVFVGGRLGELVEAEGTVRDDVWRLELLVIPLALLLLAAAMGLRLAAAPLACAAIAVAGGLAGLRVAGALAEPSALAIVPTIAVGVALGIELSALLVARWEDETRLSSPIDALRDTLVRGAGPVAFAALAAGLGSAGLLATAYQPAASIACGCALAAVFAMVACALVMPAAFTVAARRTKREEPARERRLAQALATVPRFFARGRVRAALAVALAVLVAGAIAYPAHEGQSRALEARDLPAGSPGAQAAAIAQPNPRAEGAAGQEVGADSLFESLPLAGALAAGLLGIAFAVRMRSLRSLPLGLAAVLPAAAACGVLALVFQEGTPSFGGVDTGPLSPGALAAAVTALTAIAGARGAAAIDAVRSERELDPGAPGVAERAAGLTLPAALMGTAITGAAAAVLVGIDLSAARQLGVALAVGLLVDLAVIRPATLAALARWQAPSRAPRDWRRRLALPRWPRRAKAQTDPAASAS